MIETGKKAAQSIAYTGRQMLDNGKQTFHTIQTNGQAIIDTGERKAKIVADTGREAIDTGKRTAKEIQDTAHKVDVKGKEVYETSQKYIEKGQKVVNAVKEKVPEMLETGQTILEDERKVKAITAGVTIGATIVASSTIAASTVAFQTKQKEELMDEIDKGNKNGSSETNGLTNVNDGTDISGNTKGLRSLRTSEVNDIQPSAGQKFASKNEKLVFDSRTSASSSVVSAKFSKGVPSVSNRDKTLSESVIVSRTLDTKKKNTKEKFILASNFEKTASATQEMAKSESISSVLPTKEVISPSFGVRNNEFAVSTTKPMPRQAIKNRNHTIPLQGKNKTMTAPKLVPGQIGLSRKASFLQSINNRTASTPPSFGVQSNPFVASLSNLMPKEATKNENHVSTKPKFVPGQIRSNGKASFLQPINNRTASTPPSFGVHSNPFVESLSKPMLKEATKNENHVSTKPKLIPGQIGLSRKASFLQPINNRTASTPPSFGVQRNPFVASSLNPMPKEATKNENHVSTKPKLIPGQIRSNSKTSFLKSINNRTASNPPSFGVQSNPFVASSLNPMPKEANKNENHVSTKPKLVPVQIRSNGKASFLQPINNRTASTPTSFGVQNNPYVASTSKPMPKEATKNENHVILLQDEDKTSITPKFVSSQIRSNGKASFLQPINNRTASIPPSFGVQNNPYVASTSRSMPKEGIKNISHILQGKKKTMIASKPFPGQIGSNDKAPSLQPMNNRTTSKEVVDVPTVKVPGTENLNYASLSNETNVDSYAPPMIASDDPPKPIVKIIEDIPGSKVNRTISLINDEKKFPLPYVNTFGIRDKKANISSNSTKTTASSSFGVASSFVAKGQDKKIFPMFPQEIHTNNNENTKSCSSEQENPAAAFVKEETKFSLLPQGALGLTSKKIDSINSSSNKTGTSSGPRPNFGVPTKTTKTFTNLLPVQNEKRSHFPPFSVPSTQIPSFGVPNSHLQTQEKPYVSNEIEEKTDETNCSDFTDSSGHDVPTVVKSSSSSYNTNPLPAESAEVNLEKRTDTSSTQVVNEDFKKSMSTLDEMVLSGNDEIYIKSPDELMAEVMRIAREQEESEAR